MRQALLICTANKHLGDIHTSYPMAAFWDTKPYIVSYAYFCITIHQNSFECTIAWLRGWTNIFLKVHYTNSLYGCQYLRIFLLEKHYKYFTSRKGRGLPEYSFKHLQSRNFQNHACSQAKVSTVPQATPWVLDHHLLSLWCHSPLVLNASF